MKVLVVGTGSIGRRHISNLLHLGVEVYAYSYRGKSFGAQNLGASVTLLEDWSDGLCGDIDAVIVANSSEQHVDVALRAARMGKAVYIEKPLSISLDKIDELAKLIETQHLVVETGFMLRAHPNLVWFKKAINDGILGELMYLRASVGQWLPNWRPDTDHRVGYSAFYDRGGGVIFDLIHELDLVNWLAGRVVDVAAMTHHVPILEIQTEAVAQICLRLESGALAQVHVDYVRPGYSRTLEMVGYEGVLSWDYSRGEVLLGLPGGSTEVVHSIPSDFCRNSMFLAYMEHFLRRLSAPTIPPLSSFWDGVAALRVALACHRSASERRNVLLDEVGRNFEITGTCQ
jgi:predicted dehydrogenase